MKYKRVLLKLSGEALAGEDNFGINAKTFGVVSQVHKWEWNVLQRTTWEC